MAEYLIQDSTLGDIADAIRAKTGDNGLINPEDMADEIDGLATVTEGYEIISRTSDNAASKVKVICSSNTLWKYACSEVSTSPWRAVTEWVLPETLTDFSNNYVFYNSGITTITLPNATNVGYLTFYDCRSLRSVYLPKCATLGPQTFVGGAAYETIQIGSVGYPCTSINNTAFRNHPYGDTITVYTVGSYVDTAVLNVRNGATAATIIIKASENTTYNNVSYTAGDTIVTSVPETTE